MKIKTTGLLLLFVFCIFMIGAVSASDDTNDNMLNSNMDVDEVTYADDIGVDDNEIQNANDEESIPENDYDPTSFMALDRTIKNAPGSEIKLTQDYAYNESCDSELTWGITISKSLTIDGNGKTIDANGKARIFNVEPNCKLILKNLIIVNGYSDGDGGAIYVNNANLTVTNCYFNNNKAVTGGAIYAYDSNVVLTHSRFLKNHAEDTGGCIIARKTNVDVLNNVFEDNHAAGGGSLMLLANGKKDLTANIKNNVFKNSTATSSAGFFYTSLQSTVVSNCTFENYDGGEYGGISADGNIEISDSTFRNSYFVKGGALNLNGNSKISRVINCIFENNRASNGGAIYSTHKLTLNDNHFKNNTAEMYGGAIYDAGNFFDIADNAFTDNNAKIDGGAIYLEGAVEIRTYKKWASYGSATYRLTVASITGTSSMYNAYLNYDTLMNFGITDYTSDNRVDSLLDYYKAGGRGPVSASRDFNAYSGSVQYDAENLVTVGEGKIFKNVFLNNNANEKGGAIYATANNLIVRENNFINNSAKDGSAICISEKSQTRSCVVDASADTPKYSESTTKIDLKKANAYIITLYDYKLQDAKINRYMYSNIEMVVGHNVTVLKNTFTLNKANAAGNVIIDEGTNTTIENNADKNAKSSSTIYSKSQYVSISENAFDDSQLKTILSLKASNEAPNLNEDFEFIVTLKDELNAALPNQMVQLTIQNKTYPLTTDKNGIAKLAYKLNTTEALTVNVKYDENSVFNQSASTLNIKARIATVISASSLTTVYNGGAYLVVSLKDINGKALSGVRLSIDLNGKIYTPSTDVNGQVKLSADGLTPNRYLATITFAGNDYYGKSSISVEVIVTKAKPKLSAGKKTFKKSVKVKKYTITLKTNKNKPLSKVKVNLNVKGKKYNAKTNVKGKATFKIKNLKKKGKFKATVTFKGNNCYNKATKKVVIIVK